MGQLQRERWIGRQKETRHGDRKTKEEESNTKNESEV